MKKQEEESDYEEETDYILENISDELSNKLSRQDIVTLLKLEEEYIDKRYEENLKRKPFVPFDLVIIDQEDINYYVMTNAIKHNIILDDDEIFEIMYAEIDYMEETGQSEDSIHFN